MLLIWIIEAFEKLALCQFQLRKSRGQVRSHYFLRRENFIGAVVQACCFSSIEKLIVLFVQVSFELKSGAISGLLQSNGPQKT